MICSYCGDDMKDENYAYQMEVKYGVIRDGEFVNILRHPDSYMLFHSGCWILSALPGLIHKHQT